MPVVDFDVEYPVVGRLKLETGAETIILSDAYFFFLAERIPRGVSELFDIYNDGAGPWGAVGNPMVFMPSAALEDSLRAVLDDGFDLDLSRVRGLNGVAPTPSTEVLRALIEFISEAVANCVSIKASTLP
ncbi:MAG: hypothetical protein AAFZ38_09685 [Myxococcota bacterium]